MLESKINLFQNIFGKYQTSSKNEFLFFCPEHDHHKKKFSVNFQKNVAKCWFCGNKFGSLKQVVKKYGTFADVQEWKQINGITDFSEHYSIFSENKNSEPKERIVLPKEYICLANKSSIKGSTSALQYLKDRNITKKDVYEYKIGFCEDGEYGERVIFPSFDLSGRINYFVGRTYNKKVTFEKYKNPAFDSNIIFNELLLDWRKTIVLVEGVFDAVKCKNSVPLLGSSLSEDSALFRKLIETSDDVIIALDEDAWQKQEEMAHLFYSYDIKPYLVTGLQKDFGEMSKEDVSEKIRDAEEYSFKSVIRQKLRRV